MGAGSPSMRARRLAGQPEPVSAPAPWPWILRLRRLIDSATFRAAAALSILFVSADVFAQFSGSASLVSDYRYRGVSLSHNKPAAQLAVTYDDASGWYGGAFASTVQLFYPSTELQLISFVGYAKRMPSGVTWEAGGDYSVVTGPLSYSYPEVFLGVASDNLSARLYYAPRYFGQDSEVIYGEVNAAQPLLDNVRLVAHGGALLNSIQGGYAQRPEHRVFDASVGVAVDFDHFNVQLSWVGISSASTPYPVTTSRSKNGVVLILSRSF
jgi:uncharacterized protein (TIGR02001 family)